MMNKMPTGNGKGNAPQKGGLPIAVELGLKSARISVKLDAPSPAFLKMRGLIERAIGTVLPMDIEVIVPTAHAKTSLMALTATVDVRDFVLGNMKVLDNVRQSIAQALLLNVHLESMLPGAHQAGVASLKSHIPRLSAAAARLQQANAKAASANVLVERAERQENRASEAARHTQEKLGYFTSGQALADVQEDLTGLQMKLGRSQTKLDEQQSQQQKLEAVRSGISTEKEDASNVRAGGKRMTKPQQKGAKKLVAQKVSKLGEQIGAVDEKLELASMTIEQRKQSIAELQEQIGAKQATVELLENGSKWLSGRMKELNSELALQQALLTKEQNTLGARTAALAAAQQKVEAARADFNNASASFQEAAKAALAPFESPSLRLLLRGVSGIQLCTEDSTKASARFLNTARPENYGPFASSLEATFVPARAVVSMASELGPEFEKLDAAIKGIEASITRLRGAEHRREFSEPAFAENAALSLVAEHEELAGKAASFFPQCTSLLSKNSEKLRDISAAFLHVAEVHRELVAANAPDKQQAAGAQV